jgi:hypothetical protein
MLARKGSASTAVQTAFTHSKVDVSTRRALYLLATEFESGLRWAKACPYRILRPRWHDGRDQVG